MRFALLIALLLPSMARAQCAIGRVVGPETAGRCCWPAQRWNDAAARCEGPPDCPAGWGGEGDACVRSSSIPESAVFDEFEDPSAVRRLVDTERPRPIEGESASMRPLWISGVALFSVAYLYSVVTGTVFQLGGCCANAWPMYIPLVGGIIWPVIEQDYYYYSGARDWALALGLPGAAVQIGGAVLLILGIAIRRPTHPARLGAAQGGIGLTVDL